MTERWEEAGLGVFAGDERFQIGGVGVWSRRWLLLPDPAVKFREPHHGELRSFDVYELDGPPHIRFAACELSNCVWGFLVPIDGKTNFD